MCVRYGKSIGHYLFVTVGKSKAKTMTKEKCIERTNERTKQTHTASASENTRVWVSYRAVNGRKAGKKPNKRTYIHITHASKWKWKWMSEWARGESKWKSFKIIIVIIIVITMKRRKKVKIRARTPRECFDSGAHTLAHSAYTSTHNEQN